MRVNSTQQPGGALSQDTARSERKMMKIQEAQFLNGLAWLKITNGNGEFVGYFQIVNPVYTEKIRQENPKGIEFTANDK